MFDEGDQEVFNHTSESGSSTYSQLDRTIPLEFKNRLQHVKRITTLCLALAIESRVPANSAEIQEDQRPLLRSNLAVGPRAQRFAGAPRRRQVVRLSKGLNLPVPHAAVHD
jgi:hypothetical protein